MQSESSDKHDQYLVYTDILTVFTVASDLQWKAIRDISVYRILYLASVLYSFINPAKDNPFSIYNFNVNPGGPYDEKISKALSFLLKDDYLKRMEGEDILTLGDNSIKEVFKIESAADRMHWLKQIMYILGIYGEDKIYEFIFRDPEYQTSIKSNTTQGLDTTGQNETVKALQNFQAAFEDTLDEDPKTISAQQYLQLYFEYIFSKILKREGME